MKRICTELGQLLVPILVAASSGCHGPGPPDQPVAFPSRDAALAEVKRITKEQEAAWNRGDLEQFMALGYFRSPDLTFYSGGEVTRGYDAMLAHYLQRYKTEGKETGKLTFKDMEFMYVSDFAIMVRGRWDIDFVAEKDTGGLYTILLWRFPEGWRIVHDHTSVDG